MKRVLVTGATGFVGANLVRRLLRDGHEVHLLLRPRHDAWRIEEIRGDVRLHEARLEDAEAVARGVSSVRPDWVFHLAAYGAYPTELDLPRMIQTNVVGTMHLVEACLRTGFEAFVNTGSSSEYGFKAHAPPEDDWLEPNSHYAVTKASATLYCRFTAQSRRVHLITLRLYSVYGPYEEPTRLLPTLVTRALKGELPPLVDPDVARDYVYVEDVCHACLLAAGQPNQERGAVYNVGTGVQTRLREVVELTRRHLGLTAEPSWGSMPNRTWDTHSWVADHRKISQALGWQPQHSFEQGFGELVDWFRDRPSFRAFYEARQQAAR